MKTHLPGEPGKTLCGKWVEAHEIQTDTMFRSATRSAPLQLIGKNDLVDFATCKACQRVDDVKQVRDYQRECKESGINPVTGTKL